MRLAFLIFLIALLVGAGLLGREVVTLKRPTTKPKRVVAIITIQRLVFDDGTDSGDQFNFVANIEAGK